MRLVVAVCVVAATGCSVEVGAGSIDSVAIDEPIDAAAAPPPVSLSMELEFLSADQSASIADQYGSKLSAVRAIDVSVTALGLSDDLSGAEVAGATIDLSLPGVTTIDHVAQRVRLTDVQMQQVLAAIRARAALTVPLTAIADWPAPAPASMTAHAVLQPIIVVDTLSAL